MSLLIMIAYRYGLLFEKRRIVKSFEVDSIQQIKGDWFVETMIVRTYPEDAKSKPTSSFLKLVPKK